MTDFERVLSEVTAAWADEDDMDDICMEIAFGRIAQETLAKARALVDEQAGDEALWALNLDGTVPIAEAYLQQELRRLHALIESATAKETNT